MQISVKTLLGDTTTLEVTPSDTISQLKSLIEAQTGTHADRQKLMHGKMELSNNSRTLKESNIQENDTVFLYKKRMQIQVLTPDDEIVAIEVDDTTTIEDIKLKLEELVKMSAVYQRLFYGKEELEGSSTVAALKMRHKELLYVSAREKIKLFVLMPDLTTKELDLKLSTRVIKVKEMLEETGVLSCDQKLYYGTIVLQNDLTLGESRVSHLSTLYLIQKKNSASIGRIKMRFGDRVTNLRVEDTLSLRDLKQRIRSNPQETLGRSYAPARLCLSFSDHVLKDDEKTLKEFGIERDSLIDVNDTRFVVQECKTQ